VSTEEVKQPESRRLAELRRAYPIDATLENLLSVLRSELDLCARLPIFAYEATTEGHHDCASLLRTLAGTERAHVEQVLTTLQRHLEQRGLGTEVAG
jgi:rubrerythrin